MYVSGYFSQKCVKCDFAVLRVSIFLSSNNENSVDQSGNLKLLSILIALVFETKASYILDLAH